MMKKYHDIFDDGNDEEDDDLVEEQEGKQPHHWIFQSSEVFQAHFFWDITDCDAEGKLILINSHIT